MTLCRTSSFLSWHFIFTARMFNVMRFNGVQQSACKVQVFDSIFKIGGQFRLCILII